MKIAIKVDTYLPAGTVVTHTRIFNDRIGIKDSLIFKIVEGQETIPADETIDVSRKIILSGLIDAHVHFNEPIEGAPWEGCIAGSRAAAGLDPRHGPPYPQALTYPAPAQ